MANSPTPSPSSNSSAANLAVRFRNLVIVLVAVILSVAIFLGLRTETGTATLSTIAESSVPLNVALTNDKPTLIEFYANWCTSCQAMAPDMAELKRRELCHAQR